MPQVSQYDAARIAQLRAAAAAASDSSSDEEVGPCFQQIVVSADCRLWASSGCRVGLQSGVGTAFMATSDHHCDGIYGVQDSDAEMEVLPATGSGGAIGGAGASGGGGTHVSVALMPEVR